MSQGQPGWIDEALREHTQHEELDAARRQLPLADREQQVLDRIDHARRRRPRVREERITMSHGAGGKATQTLIEAVFLDAFRNPLLEPLEDAAQLLLGGSRVALTTDSYVVEPAVLPRRRRWATWPSTAPSTTCRYPGPRRSSCRPGSWRKASRSPT